MPGSIEISDCWKAYSCLKDHDYKILQINHSLHNKHPDIGAHTNSIEGTWSAIKHSMINNRNHVADQFDSYLANVEKAPQSLPEKQAFSVFF